MTRTVPRNLSAKTPEVKQFYWLVAGNVHFTVKDSPEEPRSIPVNAILTTETGVVPVSALSRANQGLAQAALDKVGHDVGMTVYDVQPIAFSKLGHMLPSEFHDLQEPKTQDDVAPAKVQ